MKLPSFIKLPRHRRFRYSPNYYDEVAEARKQRHEGQAEGRSGKRIVFRRRLQSRRTGTGVFRLLSVLAFTAMALGYVWSGSWVFYGLLPALYGVGVYMYVRRMKRGTE